ncbi:MAG TPA: cysteine desulfurase [Bacillota bacterium]|nr:cysteine desulfurase [Bacillota bacterium]
MTTPIENLLSQWANQIYREAIIPEDLTPFWEKSLTIDEVQSLLPYQTDYYYLQREVDPSLAEGLWHSPLDIEAIRKDFPILARKVNGKPLIWFDNAATSQKPAPVIEAISHYYREYNSNVHRGSHTLANEATDAFEKAREKVRQFIGAPSPDLIVFTRGTTEAINLVAQSYGRMILRRGDPIIITMMEHHSNIVPWQLISEQTGAVLKVVPINDDGSLDLDAYQKLLATRPALVALTHVSNVLGTINPVRLMTQMAHDYGVRVLVDGAQATPHLPVNVTELDVDFYVFSGHKTYGPTGIGVLYGKRELLEAMPPWQGGGNMIKDVHFDHTLYNRIPHKFEAGTGNIADAVGLGAAIEYLQGIGMTAISQHEQKLTAYAMNALTAIPQVRVIGTAPHKTSVISFTVANCTLEKLAHRLDEAGIAVRFGHHCAQPVLRYYGLEESLRVSFGLYNTQQEVDRFIEVLYQNIDKPYRLT